MTSKPDLLSIFGALASHLRTYAPTQECVPMWDWHDEDFDPGKPPLILWAPVIGLALLTVVALFA